MPERKGGKVLVSISSSSSEEEEEDEEEDEEETDGGDDDSDYEEEEEDVDDDEGDDDGEVDDEDVISVSSSGDMIDEEADCESADDDLEASPDNKDSCNRVMQLLQGLYVSKRRFLSWFKIPLKQSPGKCGHDLNVLKLEECKAYLRNHRLRVAGTKSICIERIQEHWRIKDGNGEKLYPRSSFVINCTGDVCKGDVVLFTQRVYKKFDVVSRGGEPIGKRTIAGRVVKESYGAAKQQHTFTVEILWSKGVKKFSPLFPLLVKGRNLYRLKTFRQHWDDEAQRLKVLAEKHKRGAAARQIRAMKKAQSASGGAKHGKHSCHATLQSKAQRNEAHHNAQNHDTGSSNGLSSREAKANRNSNARASKTLISSKRKRHSGRKSAPGKRQRKCEPNPPPKTTKHNINRSKASSLTVGEPEMKPLTKPSASESVHESLQRINAQRDEFPALQPAAQNGNPYQHHHSQMQLHQRGIPPAFISSGGMHHYSSYEVGSTSTAARLFARQPIATQTHHPSFNNSQRFSNSCANSSTGVDRRVSSHLRTQVDIDRQLHTKPRGVHAVAPKSDSLTCPTPGCKDTGAKNCVGSLCWNCCRRRAWKCPRHKLH